MTAVPILETPAPLWAEALDRKERQIARKGNGDAHIVERLMPAMWALAAADGTRREIPPGTVQSRRSRIRRQNRRSSRQCCTVHPVADRWRRIPDTADTVGQSSNDGEMIDERNQTKGYGKKAARPGSETGEIVGNQVGMKLTTGYMNVSFMKKLDFPAEYSILIIIGEWLRWSSFIVNAAPFSCFASNETHFRNPQALWHKQRTGREWRLSGFVTVQCPA